MARPDSNPWDRRPRESEEAHGAFIRYRDLGAGRSLRAVGEVLGKSEGILERWSCRWAWVDRARAWDNHLGRERDKVAAAEARKWEHRRIHELEDVYECAQSLRDKARAMLATPIVESETSDDGKTTVIRPARWALRDAAAMFRVAAELGAAACEAAGRDPAIMTADERDAFFNSSLEKVTDDQLLRMIRLIQGPQAEARAQAGLPPPQAPPPAPPPAPRHNYWKNDDDKRR